MQEEKMKQRGMEWNVFWCGKLSIGVMLYRNITRII